MSRDELNADCAELASVQAWVDARKIAQSRRYHELAIMSPSIEPEPEMARASRGGRRDAEQASRRADVLGNVPQLEDALQQGEVSAAHVDVMGRALAGLNEHERARLSSEGERVRELATGSTPERFQSQLNRIIRQLQPDGGAERLLRQKRDTRLRFWLDPISGMYKLAGEFDPESGLALRG